MSAIDVGNPAIERELITSPNYTYIIRDNPANASGLITEVEIVCSGSITGLEVATFYNVSGLIFSTRDTHLIGDLVGGYNKVSDLNILVNEGDYIGFYIYAGSIKMSAVGGVAYWFVSGDKIPCTDFTFAYTGSVTRQIGLYGTGTTVLPKGVARTGIYSFKTLK